jgi:hypothetical protein
MHASILATTAIRIVVGFVAMELVAWSTDAKLTLVVSLKLLGP